MPVSMRQVAIFFVVISTFLGIAVAEDVPTDYVTYSIEETKIGDRAGTNGQGLVGSKADVLIGSEARDDREQSDHQ